ncbi:MAG: two pore domain potassium channel family protein, partial [Bifidobacteriaceae bacterium]|nr:two pore domain potassium channel family protein [Bifidobacteriaceae bacterium]
MEWPLTAVALIMLAAYALPVANPDVPRRVSTICEAIMWVTWAVFAFDYVARFIIAPRRWDFFKHNLFDLAVVVLPMLRPLRLLRVLALLSVFSRVGGGQLRGKVAAYAAGCTLLLGTIAALEITRAERGQPGTTIANLGDGFWWTITTI